MVDHVFNKLYLPSKLFAASFSLLGLLEYIVLCNGNHLDENFNDVLYGIVRVNIELF